MLVQPIQGSPQSAHVVVLGNEKGGSGKSTTALHIAVALLKAGQRVATIDLDSRQQSFTHYIENRRDWAARARIKLELPTHYCIERAEGPSVEANEAKEFANFSQAIGAIEHTHDVVVIDTPGNDTYLMRLAHSMADTLVTPLNDSFLDFDVLATLDPTNFAVTGESHYAEMVREARRQRRCFMYRVCTCHRWPVSQRTSVPSVNRTITVGRGPCGKTPVTMTGFPPEPVTRSPGDSSPIFRHP